MGILNDFRWLSKFGPVFGVHGKNVQIIHEPTQFYKTLNTLALESEKRIVLAALYLGTGVLEQTFVQNIRKAISNKPSTLRLTVLLDCTRGSRGNNISSRTMLTPLIGEFGTRVQVSLYHTPKLRGLLRLLLPQKWNEIIGVQHIKVYIFDDNVILSGANLSDQYFETRQDRYILFKNSPELANYYTDLVESVGRFSFQLNARNELQLKNETDLHPHKTPLAVFAENCRKLVEHSIRPNKAPEAEVPYDTHVYPLIQMRQLQFGNDYAVTRKLLASYPEGSSVKLATGYFNLVPEYEDSITKGRAAYDVLTAHPKANSFYNAAGVMYFIPTMYSLLLKLFLEKSAKAQNFINIWEYERKNWTFHGKGLWYYAPGEGKPGLTMIGSPNFGFRSVNRDLESQIVLVTENEELRNALHEEQQNIFKPGKKVTQTTFKTPERSIPSWLYLATKICRSFF